MTKLIKIALFAILSFCLANCATHGTFVTEQKDAWIDGYSVKSNYADKGLHFCKANVKENGLAEPICFRAKFTKFENERPNVEAEKKSESAKK